MKRKIVIGLIALVLAGVIAHFLGIVIVIVALIFLGIGFLISRRRKPHPKGKDVIVRIRR